jgi:hypothetical protein
MSSNRKQPKEQGKGTTWWEEPSPQPGQAPLWHSRQGVSLDGAPWQVLTTWTYMEGRYEPVEVTVRAFSPGRSTMFSPSRPVVGNSIRRLPLGRLQQEARKAAATEAAAWGAGSREALALTGIAGPHRGVAASVDDLKEVAAVYLAAYWDGLSVTEAVADRFTIAKSTAAKRIMAAKKAGLLNKPERLTR